MPMNDKEPFQPGDRVRHFSSGLEGTVKSTSPGARRRIEWDDDRVTLTHVGDLRELVD